MLCSLRIKSYRGGRQPDVAISSYKVISVLANICSPLLISIFQIAVQETTRFPDIIREEIRNFRTGRPSFLKPLFEIDHLSYQLPKTDKDCFQILKDINFSVQEGELIALIGSNGSGKTTLARHLNALLIPTSGNVLVNGINTRNQQYRHQIRAEVGMVFQQPEDQIMATIIEEDIAFGPENLCRLPSVIREQVDEALAVVNMQEHRFRQSHLLSAGQMQRVALAGVLAMQPRCIILDEATAMLDPKGRNDILARMTALNRMGITVIFITHFMEEVMLAQRALLLNHGGLIFDGKPESLFSDDALLDAGGLEKPAAVRFYQCFPALFRGIENPVCDKHKLFDSIITYTGKKSEIIEIPFAAKKARASEIEIRELTHTYMAGTPLAHLSLRNITMDVQKDIPHGLIGATGSGKSTLLQHLNGLYRPQHGSIRVGPFDLNAASLDVKALRSYAGIVFQNPESFFFEQYVGDEIAFGPKQIFGTPDLRGKVMRAMELVDLDFNTYKDRIVSTLSGGEKRKTALAATLAMSPSLLILDEPTAGLDPYSRKNLLSTLHCLQTQGVQIVISSHNMEDISEIAQNVTVLSKGSTLTTMPVDQVFTDPALSAETGMEPPAAWQMAQALRKKGWPISYKAIAIQEIIEETSAAMNWRSDESI